MFNTALAVRVGLDRRNGWLLLCQMMDSQVFLNFRGFHSQASDNFSGFVRTNKTLKSSADVRLKIHSS